MRLFVLCVAVVVAATIIVHALSVMPFHAGISPNLVR